MSKLLVSLVLVALVCVALAGKHHPPYPPPPPYPGGVYSYGRAFGSVTTWYRNDVGSAHHLELNFTAIKDLDSGAVYTNFQANMNVRSNDGSDVQVAILNGTDMTQFPALMAALKGGVGVRKLHASEGIAYGQFLKEQQFNPMSEDAVLSLYEQTIKLSQNGGQTFVFGQLYADANGAHGIHDVHRIVGNEFKDYGDGGFIVRDSQGKFYGVFLHFDNQPCC